MQILKHSGIRSTIHGIPELIKAQSIKSRTIWTLSLIGVACFIPYNLLSLFKGYSNAPSATFIYDSVQPKGYRFPVVRLCPKHWVNSTRVFQLGLEKEEFLYSISLFRHVSANIQLENITKAELGLGELRSSKNMSHMRDLYLAISYDVDELFECIGCQNITSVVTIWGVCYDFLYTDHTPAYGNIGRSSQHNLLFHPPIENLSDSENANSWYRPAFQTDVLYVDVNEWDYFAFEPIFLERNRSYMVNMVPLLRQRIPGKDQQQCLEQVDPKISFHMCQLNCREVIYGTKCWGHMHYGLALDISRKRGNLPWYSSLKKYTQDENLVRQCEEDLSEEVTNCINTCYTTCTQWQYEIQVGENRERWFNPPLRKGGTSMTGAEYVTWRRRIPAAKLRFPGRNVTNIVFVYEAPHGVRLMEEQKRQTPIVILSNVGGMMGLVAGASMLSLCHLAECVVRLCLKRICSVKKQYTL